MVFTRFVEVGRVVLVNNGPDTGKLAVIVDVIDMARVLVDGPTTGVKRQAMSYKNISLTDFVVEIPRSLRSSKLAKAFNEAEISSKWEQTAWAKKLALRKKRASLSDFDRFVVKVNKQKRSKLVNTQFNKLKKSA